MEHIPGSGFLSPALSWAIGLDQSRLTHYDGVKARPRSCKRPAVTEAEVTGDAESDELTGWHGFGWIY